VWKAHHRGFRHFAVRHQGRFHLCGANAVPADVDDVVHAAGEPIEAVLANAAGEKMRDFRGKETGYNLDILDLLLKMNIIVDI